LSVVVVRAGTTPEGEGPPVIENKRGSDLTGVHGAANRTYDLKYKSEKEIIYVQGAFLYPTADYTKSTVGGITRLTFLNKVYDELYIRIIYWTI